MTSEALTGTVAEAYGTALRHTAILLSEPGDPDVGWIRTAPHPDHLFTPCHGLAAPPHLPDGSRFVSGSGDETRRRYRLPASESLAARSLAGRGRETDWARVYRLYGSLLGRLHALPADADEPPARIRLRRWWNDEWQVGEHRRDARARYLEHLTPDSRRRLSSILDRDLVGRGRMVHGWAGLGQVTLDASGGIAALVGEDVGSGPPEYDLGALVAQSVEFALFSPPGTTPSPTNVRRELLSGHAHHFSGVVSPDLLADHIVEHVVRHVADFTWFADFPPEEIPRWSHLTNWLVGDRDETGGAPR